MQLDERKLKILQAIIRNYLETGEPVGSRTISKYTDLNLSSATIRNEMSDLEEMGYILQPHTSSGRIPSDKGYRLYVDTMMEEKVQEIKDMRNELEQKADKIDMLLQHVAKLLAVNTNYATVVSAPRSRMKKVKFVQLTQVDDEQLLVVVVIEGNKVKNRMLRMEERLSQENILKLNIILNTCLQGLDLTEINMMLIQKMKEQAAGHGEILSRILDEIARAVSEEESEVYTSGVTNILKYPELGDRQKAAQLLGAFEEKEQLSEILNESPVSESKDGIQVYIGSETPAEVMKDCSMVTATYEIEEGVYGRIGIVGPKRMDYEKVVNTLHTMMVELDDIFKRDKKISADGKQE